MCKTRGQSYPCVYDLLEVDSHRATIQIREIIALVDEYTDLLRADLVGTVTKHKQHGVDNVGFSATIRSHNRRKALQ